MLDTVILSLAGGITILTVAAIGLTDANGAGAGDIDRGDYYDNYDRARAAFSPFMRSSLD